jgi:plastocyanin
MAAAVPRPRRTDRAPGSRPVRGLRRTAASLAGCTIVAVGCAPANTPPNIEVRAGGAVVTQVVDAYGDAGRMPSAAVDADGNPVVGYLLLKKQLKTGELPQPVVPNTPQPPAVVMATFLPDQGYWSRRSVTPQDYTKAKGLAQGIAFSDGTPQPGVNTAVAVDKDGHHHVAWATPLGVFYSSDVPGETALPDAPPVFSDPQQVAPGPATGVSIALDSAGNPSLAFYAGNQVMEATLQGKDWTADVMATVGPCTDCPPVRTAIQVGGGVGPVVAYTDPAHGDPVVTSRTEPLPNSFSGPFVSSTVQAGTGGFGISLALGKDGSAHVAYYGKDGKVYEGEADRVGGAWTVNTISTPSASPSPSSSTGPDTSGWTTGVGVTDAGTVSVTWADPSQNVIMLATGNAGALKADAVPESDGGRSPALAVSPDGRSFVLPFYDSVQQHLNVATPAIAGLAAPSPTPSPPPTGPPELCQPSGSTDLSISAKAIAFDVSCLAAPVGTPFTIAFDNQDAGIPHNVDIYKDAAFSEHLAGATGPTDTIIGPTTTTYDVDALSAGTYFFKCDVHPNMTGIFVVAKASGGSTGSSASPSPSPSG